jgi:hypothetical protein
VHQLSLQHNDSSTQCQATIPSTGSSTENPQTLHYCAT